MSQEGPFVPPPSLLPAEALPAAQAVVQAGRWTAPAAEGVRQLGCST